MQTAAPAKSRRLVATLATVGAAASLAAGPGAAAASAGTSANVGGCNAWMCGMNHNEVMATTRTAS